MKWMRRLHIYLGCFFAPLIILFAATGTLQVYHFHQTLKDGSYTAPYALQLLSSIHLGKFGERQSYQGLEVCEVSDPPENCHQKVLDENKARCKSCTLFPILLVCVGLGLVVNAILGIYMAFAMIKLRKSVWLTLGAGIALPVIFVILQAYLI